MISPVTAPGSLENAGSAPAAGVALDRPGQALLFVSAAAILGQALQISNGHQDSTAILLLTISSILAVLGVVIPRVPALAWFEDKAIFPVLGLALIWSFSQLTLTPPGVYLQPRTPVQILEFYLALSAAAVLAGAGLSENPVLGNYRMLCLLAIHFFLGCWMIQASPSPLIDVDTIHRESVKALVHGQNPYALTFPNIYGSTLFFGKTIANDSRILVGFSYPPLSLLFATPGQVLFGDYRYSELAAMTGAGALMAWARPGRLSQSIATLFLFTPRTFFVLEQGWTDPFLVFLLAATVFVAFRRPKWVPYLFGLFVSVKQYAVLAIAFSWMLVRPFRWAEFGRSALKAAVVAAIVTLPMALWSLRPFINTLVLSQVGIPFRPDSLSYLAWMGGTQTERISLLSGIALLVAVALAAWRAPRTPSGFAAALVLMYIGFFAFGAHAFCNHYYFVIGILCCAAAASRRTPDEPKPSPARFDFGVVPPEG